MTNAVMDSKEKLMMHNPIEENLNELNSTQMTKSNKETNILTTENESIDKKSKIYSPGSNTRQMTSINKTPAPADLVKDKNPSRTNLYSLPKDSSKENLSIKE